MNVGAALTVQGGVAAVEASGGDEHQVIASANPSEAIYFYLHKPMGSHKYRELCHYN